MRTHLAILTLLVCGACTPTCEETCDKLLACDLDTNRVAEDECFSSCERQLSMYEIWDDTRLLEQFDAHRSCIVGATCDEIADGVCYDEDLFIY